jgi:hypothetical protein
MSGVGGSSVGETGLGATARDQLDKARKDPRLTRGRGAAVGDYWVAMEEAEQTRMLSVLGIYELRGVLERYEREHGVSRGDADLDPSHRGEMQALWERAELAAAAIATDFAAVNAQALLAMNGALDAMVEEFAPAMRDMALRTIAEQIAKRAEAEQPGAASKVDEVTRAALIEAMVATADESLPKLDRLRGSGAERYEARLRGAGLGTAADRPIPPDLDEALIEFGAIRDVLTHRHGRMDTKALQQAPSLARRYSDGDFVRLNGNDYRTYSAAIHCYGQDVAMRPMRSWPEVSDADLPDLAGWRGYYMLGA